MSPHPGVQSVLADLDMLAATANALACRPGPLPVIEQWLGRHWEGTWPVDMAALVTAAGIRWRADEQLPALARCGRDHHGQGWIVVDGRQPWPRQRFALAHGLGHNLLEHLAPGEQHDEHPPQFDPQIRDWRDAQANQCAGQLLVPAEALRLAISYGDDRRLASLAAQFQVSGLLMHQRLQQLGWLD